MGALRAVISQNGIQNLSKLVSESSETVGAKGILNHFEKDFASFLTVRRPHLCNVYEDEPYKDKHGKGIFMKF